MMDSYRLALSRSALLCLSLAALSCGDDKPPIKDPPQAILTVPQPNTVGQNLTVQLSASGCDSIQSLSIYDGEEFLKSVPYNGGGTITVDLGANEIKYTRGLAAQLTLKARVVCTDGRQNDSQQAPATFFPVAEVIDPPAGSGLQVVPDNFIAEGSGTSVSFIGCGTLANGAGRLFKVNKSGRELAPSLEMPFPCTSGTVVTGLDPQSRKRWVWTPDAGAMAVDEQFRKSSQTLIKVDLLTVGPGGDALAYNALGTNSGLHRISHETGASKWKYLNTGFVITSPVLNANGLVVVATINSDETLGAAIRTATVDYNTGTETNTFTILGTNTDPDSYTPPATLNADGSVLYVAIEGANQLTQVYACATLANGCEGSARRWVSPIIPGSIVALVPYANGGRLATIAFQKTWFLDANSGAIMNKGQQPLTTEGALITLQVQPGAGPYPQSFYMLNGPVPQEGLPVTMPIEIVGTDGADKGLLFRYQNTTGSIAVAVDGSGTLWMRVGKKLVRPLSPTEYRQVRPVTP